MVLTTATNGDGAFALLTALRRRPGASQVGIRNGPRNSSGPHLDSMQVAHDRATARTRALAGARPMFRSYATMAVANLLLISTIPFRAPKADSTP